MPVRDTRRSSSGERQRVYVRVRVQERAASADVRRAQIFLCAVTRLLLGTLGTTAMGRLVDDRSVLKRGSFIAVEVLGCLLV
jgi:hypothetical protein